MTLVLLKEDFDFAPAQPSVDWGAAFSVVSSVNDFVKIVDQVELECRIWRAKMKSKIADGLEKISHAVEGFDHSEIREQLFPILDEALVALDATIGAYAQPFHERREARDALEKLGKATGPAARLIRKQLNRMEDIRVAQYNAGIDMHYTIVAFLSQYEEGRDDGEVFEDGDTLEAFLKSQVA
ncbi:hypothetical protein AGR7C_Lc100174 [Agrobacterium deltaense Zutra 3/1]|uniref:Uncharacterized protein n=1 Tax=Agrobacterium deltaense Zutra 3/1 TaxID=1183427 RepID=A0A1S7QUA4_9HYPH|nr:hypothetical protein [Agrobacterium deltaense]CUX41820.1 hypothetical protein AGR7C_Lc100174 [Agrobacterium deltaense Zutra 3/1]